MSPPGQFQLVRATL